MTMMMTLGKKVQTLILGNRITSPLWSFGSKLKNKYKEDMVMKHFNNFKKKLVNKAGFSLIECVVAIGVFAILSMMIGTLLFAAISTHKRNIAEIRGLREQREDILCASCNCVANAGACIHTPTCTACTPSCVQARSDESFTFNFGGSAEIDVDFEAHIADHDFAFELTSFGRNNKMNENTEGTMEISFFHLPASQANVTMSSPRKREAFPGIVPERAGTTTPTSNALVVDARWSREMSVGTPILRYHRARAYRIIGGNNAANLPAPNVRWANPASPPASGVDLYAHVLRIGVGGSVGVSTSTREETIKFAIPRDGAGNRRVLGIFVGGAADWGTGNSLIEFKPGDDVDMLILKRPPSTTWTGPGTSGNFPIYNIALITNVDPDTGLPYDDIPIKLLGLQDP